MTTGRWIYPNGMYYIGPFAHNKPTGEGEWVFPYNGNKCKGTYTQAEKEIENPDNPDEPIKTYELSWKTTLGIY